MPGIEIRPFDNLTDSEVQNNLFLQIQAMWIKEQDVNAH